MGWPGSLRAGPSHRALGRHYGRNIERLFSKLKAALRSAAAARTVDALIEAIGEGLRADRVGDIREWFAHSGYPTPSSTVTINEKPF